MLARLVRSALLAAAAVAVGRGIGRARQVAERQAADAAKGRFSTSPVDMPLVGWMDIVIRTVRGVRDDRVLSVAAGVAFYALLALVPGLSVLVSVYGLFTPPASIPDQIALFTGLLPDAARSLIKEQAVRLANQSNGTLSLTLVVSLAIAAWSANAAVKAIFEAMNVIYKTTETRSYLRLTVESFIFTFAGVCVAILTLITMAVIPGVLALLTLQPETERVLNLVRWPLFFLPVFGAIVLFYQRGPCRTPPRIIWILPGAVLASLVWAAASYLFSWYVSTLGTYPATYGSLATVVVLLVWLWISTIILLGGAELDAEIERQIRPGSP